MSLQIPCSHCQSLLIAPENSEGQLIRCPRCQNTTRVPSGPAATSPPPIPPASIAPAPEEVRVDDDRPRPAPPRDDDEAPRRRSFEDEHDAQRPRKQIKSESALGSTLGKIGIGGLVIAVVLGVLTWLEGTIAFQSSAQPEDFTLKALIARGPDGNPYVRVSQFVLCPNYVNQFNTKNPGVWTHVWIPAVPLDEVKFGPNKEPITPNNVKILFFSTSIRNEQELGNRLAREKVEGLVNTRTSLSSETRRLLQQSYGGIDLDKCIILQEGRTPFSRGLIYLMGGGAIIFLLVGTGLLILAFARKRT
jgi:phage FluMu protein Com